jgi:hypothetical protein
VFEYIHCNKYQNLTNSNQQTQSYKFTSHIAAFLSMILITEMLEICIMIICAFENSLSIPSFLVTKIVYIGYGQLKKLLLFLLPFHICAPSASLYFYILLLLMPVSGSVLLLYAGAHKI